MSKYQEALDDIKHIIINVLGMYRYEDAINVLQELVHSRHIQASTILKDSMLYGDSYYKIEDWLNKCLEGNIQDLPAFMESEYLKCALRIEVRDYFKCANVEFDDELIEEVVDRLLDSFSEPVLNQEYIEATVHKYLIEKNMEELDV